MRSFSAVFSLILLLVLTACGSEDLLTPPTFSAVVTTGTLGSTTILKEPSRDPSVTIAGTIDIPAAKIAATRTTATTPVPVDVDPITGAWSYTFTPIEGINSVSLVASDPRGNINQLFLTVNHDTTPPAIAAVTAGTDPLTPQLLVAFNETLFDTSQTTATFAVDGVPIIGATFDTILTRRIFTLPLSAALAAGPHQLTCSGVTDLSTPGGNTIAAGTPFDFTLL